MKKAIAIVSTFIFSFAIHAQKITGKLTFTQGQQFQVNTSIKTTSSQQAMGQEMEIKVEASGLDIFKVSNSGADNTTITHSVKKINVNFDGMGQKRGFNSDKPSDMKGEIGDAMKKMLAKTYNMVIDPSGTVLMTMPEEYPKDKDDDAGNMMTSMINELSALSEIPKKGSNSFFKILPSYEIGVGDTWTDTTTREEGTTITNYTLTSVNDTAIVINYISNGRTEVTRQVMGMESTTKLKTKTTGTIILDKATGIIKQRTATAESSGIIDVMNQSLPVTSTMELTMTVNPAE
ncbi:MAG: hypothetical protein JSU05_06095 [Bacteroidetes bacterium]|nr:hypothetical protein [Bacteroidota bacterium]